MGLTLRELLLRDKTDIIYWLQGGLSGIQIKYAYYIGGELYFNVGQNSDTLALQATSEYMEIILGITPPCTGSECNGGGGGDSDIILIIIIILIAILIIRSA